MAACLLGLKSLVRSSYGSIPGEWSISRLSGFSSTDSVQQGLDERVWCLSKLLPDQVPRREASGHLSDRVHPALRVNFLWLPGWPVVGRWVLSCPDRGGHVLDRPWLHDGQHLR